jgi:gas vesicle protein
MADKNMNNLGWFVVGAGLGAAAAMLFAPKSGEALRSDILAGVDQGRDFLVTRGREARTTAKSWIDSGKEVVDEKRELIDSAVERGKRVVGQQKEQISAALDAGREAIHKATAEKKS